MAKEANTIWIEETYPIREWLGLLDGRYHHPNSV